MKRRKTGGRQKGTPNKVTREIKLLARDYTPALVKELARLALRAESEQARVSAIKEMFDRGWGRPAQAVQHSGSIGSYDLSKVSDDDLRRLETILGSAALAGADQGGTGEAGAG